MSDMEPTSRRSLLKMFGVGTAALILPSKELIIPAAAVEDPTPGEYNQPVFITGDYSSLGNCVINGPVTIVGDRALLTGLVINYSGDKAAVTILQKDKFSNPHI